MTAPSKPDTVISGRYLGIFGGTFNPIHLGHVRTVEQVITAAGLDHVCYVPAAVPPHRTAPGVSAEHRLEMVQIATANQAHMTADSRELKRPGPSYTLDTILSFSAEFPDDHLYLIVGLDAMLGLESWYQWQSLLSSVNVIVMVRPGWKLPQPLPQWWGNRRADIGQLPNSKAGKIGIVQVTPVDISSTAIRDGLKNARPVQQWLHPGVWQYIQDHNLYE